MTQIIEIIVSPTGQTAVRPRASPATLPPREQVSGGGAGQRVSETLTTEFHQVQPTQQHLQGGSST